MNVCINYKYYILIELTFLKLLMLIRQMNQKTVRYFLEKCFMSLSNVCNGCHHILMSVNVKDIAILSINGVDYCCLIDGISKCEAVNFTAKAQFLYIM